VAYRLDIIVVAGLAINMVAGMAYAANQNPWAMYNGQRGATTGSVKPFGTKPQKQPSTQPAQRQFGYEYAPLDKGRSLTNPNYQRPNMQYQRQPYRPGYGFQPFGQGGFGGQFGFGMNFNPGFSQGYGGSGFPFGFGIPTMPLFGGANNYGVPYQGVPGQLVPGQGVPGVQYGYPMGTLTAIRTVIHTGEHHPGAWGFPCFRAKKDTLRIQAASEKTQLVEQRGKSLLPHQESEKYRSSINE